MCGIGGILRTDGKPIPDEWLDAIDARIAWRGPDGHGRFRDRVEIVDEHGQKRIVEVAFVHRRLSIIDHASGGQPMVSERGRNEKEGLVAVVFNGCIYNHRELRKELEGRGHKFVSDHSDTEVLIHGWREWGESVVDRLEAMYAMALWDRNTASLFLARDWFGEKPLHWRDWPARDEQLGRPDGLAFCSVSSTLSKLPLLACDPDPRSMRTWSAPYLHLGYSGVGGIEPGRYLRAMPISFQRHQFRNLPATPIALEQNSAESIEALLDAAVLRRMEADVPLGCFLSGGVDSSLVAHFARKHAAEISTFTVRMPDMRYDESTYAEHVAAHLGTMHHTLDVSISPSQDLIHLIQLLGHPFGDSSILPTYWVSKAARPEIKVALSGDGGDEMFAGYDRYRVARILARHHWWLKAIPLASLERFHPKSLLHKLGRLGRVIDDYSIRRTGALEAIFSHHEIQELVDRDSHADDVSFSLADDPAQSLRRDDIELYLPGDLLRKVDTASMACGLEVRCPFLDRDLARAALSMPIDQLMPGGQRKGLLRQIARKYLPREIVDRPKMGFAIPIGEWFRDDNLPAKGGGLKTLLLDHLNSAEPFGPIQLNKKAVQRFIDEHMSGKRDHGQRLFTLLTLSIWARSQRTAMSHEASGTGQ